MCQVPGHPDINPEIFTTSTISACLKKTVNHNYSKYHQILKALFRKGNILWILPKKIAKRLF
jgi:hypothetical protein